MKTRIAAAALITAAIVGCASHPADPGTVHTNPAPTQAPPVAKSTVNVELENATKTARGYLSTGGGGFSRKGLIDQLKYEGYSASTSTAAVDSLHVDWNDQAALVAKNYLDSQGFSRKGLTDQLVYDGFTASQAAYGVKKAGL